MRLKATSLGNLSRNAGAARGRDVAGRSYGRLTKVHRVFSLDGVSCHRPSVGRSPASHPRRHRFRSVTMPFLKKHLVPVWASTSMGQEVRVRLWRRSRASVCWQLLSHLATSNLCPWVMSSRSSSLLSYIHLQSGWSQSPGHSGFTSKFCIILVPCSLLF